MDYDSEPSIGDIPLFAAVESYIMYGNQIELYVSPQVAANIVINNVKEIAKTKDTLFDFGFSDEYEEIIPAYTAEVLPNMLVSSAKPTFSRASGDLCYDKQNEKIYVAKRDGWNKWIEILTGNSILSVSYSNKLVMKFANSGTDGVTISNNIARYTKIGSFIFLQANMIGTLDKSVVSGDCTIENLPFNPIINSPLNLGLVSFPSNRPDYMQLGTNGIITTNLNPSNEFAQNTFNIAFSVAYITN